MLRRHRILIQLVLVYFDAAMVLVAYALGIAYHKPIQQIWFQIPEAVFQDGEFLHFGMLGFALSATILGYKVFGLYESQRMRSLFGEITRVFLVNLMVFLVLVFFTVSLKLGTGHLAQVLGFTLVNTATGGLVRTVIRSFAKLARRRGYNYRNLVIVATPDRDPSPLLERIGLHRTWGYRVLGLRLPDHASWTPPKEEKGLRLVAPGEGQAFLDHNPVDEIWIDGFPGHDPHIGDFLDAAMAQGIILRYNLPRNYFPGMRWRFETFGDITTLYASHSPMDDIERALKRGMDVVVSGLILLVSGPLIMLPVAAALFFEKGGRRQVLFRQERVGLHGRNFLCFKFRSMVPDAESRKEEVAHLNEMEGPVFKVKKDPRITPLGGFLRKFSLDEFPQFFNVIQGDMSLVGPRPPIPNEVNLYERTQRRRLSVKPGITGLWQVMGRNEISEFEEWVKLDLAYIDQWSFWLDIKILLKTVPALFRGR